MSNRTTKNTKTSPATKTLKANREAWLWRMARKFAPMFKKAGFPLPTNLRVTCGFGVGSIMTLGECFVPIASKDATIEVFVSPTMDELRDVVGVLVHELCHAAAFAREDLAPENADDVWTKKDVRRGHGKVFGEIARAMLLEGKLTQTVASDELVEIAKGFEKQIGEYPHAALLVAGGFTRKGSGDTPMPKPTYKGTEKPKAQSNRHGAFVCTTEGCGWQVRTTRKHSERALPICGACYEERGEVVACEPK